MITTERLLLSPVDPGAAWELAYGQGGGWLWLGGGPGDGTRGLAGIVARAAEVGWHRPPWGLYVLVRRADAVAVGSTGFHGPPGGDGSVEIGYDLVPDARGLGFATEAVRALVGYAFTHPAVRTVRAVTAQDNSPSQRVLIRSGFTRSGLDSEDVDGLVRYRVDRYRVDR
ncbi:RimJ/RimL family protein N-acetyltransferase [Streptacidiphilus sp. MAP12-16]|uniref:GNAT family N-acetyltransferase n=1 Tax=Streptacidiphilus sp. MAP12-16 TaxID=3156300 RepID=UPI00351763A9